MSHASLADTIGNEAVVKHKAQWKLPTSGMVPNKYFSHELGKRSLLLLHPPLSFTTRTIIEKLFPLLFAFSGFVKQTQISTVYSILFAQKSARQEDKKKLFPIPSFE